jgi:diguanylate cyclase (GGDEF)-like protein
MPDDRQRLVQGAMDALDEAFAVYRAERNAAGEVAGLYLEVINPEGCRWLGVPAENLIGRELGDFSPHSRDIGLWDLVAGVAGGAQRRRERIAVGTASHPSRTLEAHAAPFGDDRVVLSLRDITEKVAAQRLLAEAYEQAANARATLQTALDATSDAFAVFDVACAEDRRFDGLRLVLINAAGSAPRGAEPATLVGLGLHEVFPLAGESGLQESIGKALADHATRTVRVHDHDDDGHWAASTAITIAPVGTERVVLTWRDVTADERRERDLARAHDQAWYAATHDPLTGLANRALLVEQMREALWGADEDDRVAVAYVDLDHFKPVNDTFGHAAGDDLLRAVASRLAGMIRTGDLASRVGGDEFVLLLRNVRQEWDTECFLQRVRAAVEQPVMLAEASITPQASYGVVVSPPAVKDIDGLLQQADSLMYRDKLSRR